MSGKVILISTRRGLTRLTSVHRSFVSRVLACCVSAFVPRHDVAAGPYPACSGQVLWINRALDPDQRARLMVGVRRFHAGRGVANPTDTPLDATALPAGLALGATFDPSLARAAGAVVGAEARARGFGVVLGGGADLTRDPRGGRNFEYVGEDPLLTGTLAGAAIAGVQGNGIVSTLKHFALNDQRNGRVVLSAVPGESAVMTSYNRVNGTYASEDGHLITDVLEGDWGFAGWVMSD